MHWMFPRAPMLHPRDRRHSTVDHARDPLTRRIQAVAEAAIQAWGEQKLMPCPRISRRPGADMRRGLGPVQQPAPRPTGSCNGMSQRCAMPYERAAGLPVGFQWTFSGAGVLCAALPTPHPVSSIRPPLNRAHPPGSGLDLMMMVMHGGNSHFLLRHYPAAKLSSKNRGCLGLPTKGPTLTESVVTKRRCHDLSWHSIMTNEARLFCTRLREMLI